MENQKPLFDVKSKYFANKKTDEIGSEIVSKARKYNEGLSAGKSRRKLWENSYKAYHDARLKGGSISVRGSTGQRREIVVNHYASIVNGIVNLTTANRPAWRGKSANTDHKSLAQTILAENLLDNYMRVSGLEAKVRQVEFLAVNYGEGHILTIWDETKGEERPVLDDKTGQTRITREGDLTFSVVNPWELIRDVSAKFDDPDWLCVQDRVNKYNEAMKYPKIAEAILSQPKFVPKTISQILYGGDSRFDATDLIARYRFFHKDNEIVLGGREVVCYESGLVSVDRGLQYPRIPIVTFEYLRSEDSAYADTPMHDILSVQKANTMTHSTIITNQNAFGVQNVTMEKGTDTTADPVGDLQFIEYPRGARPPAPMVMPQTPPEIFNYAQMTQGQMETISGLNQGARGNFEGQPSGSAMAFQQSLAVQSTSSLQNSYSLGLENLGTLVIEILQEYATTKRVAYIVGKNNQQYLKEFTKDDLKNVQRVTVDQGSAMTRTVAGRMTIASDLLQKGLITDLQQYFMVIETGTVKPITEAPVAQQMLIKDENEKMRANNMEGVVVNMFDEHHIHIPEHSAEIASTDARLEPEIVKNIFSHIMWHIKEWQEMPVELLQALKRPVLQMPPPPMGNLPPPPDGMMPPPPNGTDMPPPPSASEGEAELPSMPTPPLNPMTGERKFA